MRVDVLLHHHGFYASDSTMSSVHHGGNWAALQAWIQQHPHIETIICDVYGTLLHVTPGPENADIEWYALWTKLLPEHPVVSLAELQQKLRAVVTRQHAESTVAFPEVDWVALFAEFVPRIPARMARHHARLLRRCELMPGAAAFLREVPLPMGICSNAQAYTLMEFRLALRQEKLKIARFDPSLCFWSFQHGTAKPNPEIFHRMKQNSLLEPHQLLMVGDRLDNDIQPAREAGWNTWHLLSEAG